MFFLWLVGIHKGVNRDPLSLQTVTFTKISLYCLNLKQTLFIELFDVCVFNKKIFVFKEYDFVHSGNIAYSTLLWLS